MNISPGTVIVLIFAVLFGLAGAYTVREHLREPQVQVTEQPTVEEEPERVIYVPMASNELPANRALTLSDIAIYKFSPEKFRRQDLPAEYMSDPEQIVGRVLKQPLAKGKAFEADAFYPEGMMQSVADRLRKGLRAVTIPVEGTGALEGLVDSSSHVDVLFRTTASGDVPQRTITLVEDVEVLAVDRNVVPGMVNSTKSGTVTLAVNAQQAHRLKVVEGRGDFSLTLRALNDDEQTVATGPDTLESLLNLPRTRVKIEIFRGTERHEVELPVDPRDEPDFPITSLPAGNGQQVSVVQ